MVREKEQVRECHGERVRERAYATHADRESLRERRREKERERDVQIGEEEERKERKRGGKG